MEVLKATQRAEAAGGEDDGQAALDFVQQLGLGVVPDE